MYRAVYVLREMHRVYVSRCWDTWCGLVCSKYEPGTCLRSVPAKVLIVGAIVIRGVLLHTVL